MTEQQLIDKCYYINVGDEVAKGFYSRTGGNFFANILEGNSIGYYSLPNYTFTDCVYDDWIDEILDDLNVETEFFLTEEEYLMGQVK